MLVADSSRHVSCVVVCVFFFKQKTAYEMRISDWSSDVCSSDLQQYVGILRQRARDRGAAALTARGSGSGAREIDTDLIGDRFGRMALGRVIAAEDVIEQCLAAREIGFLFEQYDARAGLDRAAALVGDRKSVV